MAQLFTHFLTGSNQLKSNKTDSNKIKGILTGWAGSIPLTPIWNGSSFTKSVETGWKWVKTIQTVSNK